MVCDMVCNAHEGPAHDVPYNHDECDNDDYDGDGDGNNSSADDDILSERCSCEIVVLLGTTASNHPTGTSTTWNAAARASQMSTSSYHHSAMCPWQAQQHHHSLAHLRHLPAVPPDSPKPLQAAMPDSPPELSPVAPPPAASPAASDLPHSNPPTDSCLLPERGVRAWVVTHVALHKQRRAANPSLTVICDRWCRFEPGLMGRFPTSSPP